MKKRSKSLISIILVMGLLSACAMPDRTGGSNVTNDENGTDQVSDFNTGQETNDDTQGDMKAEVDEKTGTGTLKETYSGSRPVLIKYSIDREDDTVIPCVEKYEIAPDLSNIYNLNKFYLPDEVADMLVKNGFVVFSDAGSEFFEIYEYNRYDEIPNFVTVDSMMHTYHLYFSHLLKETEKNYLWDNIKELSIRMMNNSISQYDVLKGSEWESAARRNVAFFTVGAMLMDKDVVPEDYVDYIVKCELDNINDANNVLMSEVSGQYEDYTQYIPRGYYEGDTELEQYFKAMMWYGRMHFLQEDEDTDRSALLMSMALYGDAEAYGLWEGVYAVTSFFAGASDDMGVCEYMPVIREAYGDSVSVRDLIGNNEAFSSYHTKTASLSAPKINSIPIQDGDDNVILGFRFMGQRFTIDAEIMQKLIYSNVNENPSGDKRMLPDVLDVPAALGSNVALDILAQNGETEYAGYTENMDNLKEAFAKENDTLWSASLYAGWLNTLRPLLSEKGEGYPLFMQNEEWAKKSLECFAGSFAELKHDTVLYSKQVIAEMGGGGEEELDHRGYVEPEPLVYERFADLAALTAKGLKEYGMIDGDDEENLSRLSELAVRLYEISRKELKDEVLSDDEYELIDDYGGNLEHFWYEAMKKENTEQIYSKEYPAAIVVDIATDPNGEVLEAATGIPSEILVVVKVDGKLKIAKGSVYSFYQFPWPINDRLTDSKWRLMMGFEPDDDWNYNQDNAIPKPEWTESYRYTYE